MRRNSYGASPNSFSAFSKTQQAPPSSATTAGMATASNSSNSGAPASSGALPPLTRGPTGAPTASSASSSSPSLLTGGAHGAQLSAASSGRIALLQGVFGNPPPPNDASSASSSAAASGSTTSAGDPQSADTITALRSKMEKQRVELDLRTDNVNAIQRNFQRLSEMYAADRQRLQEVERNAKAMAAELDSLRAEQKLFRALQAEYAALKKHAADAEQQHSAAALALQGEVARLQQELADRAERERRLREELARHESSNNRDASQRDKAAAALLGCERALADTMVAVLDAERTLRREIGTMQMIAATDDSNGSKASSSGSTALDPLSKLKIVSVKEPQSFTAFASAEFATAGVCNSDDSNSAAALDARLLAHGSALKGFSTALAQKLSAAVRLLADGKQQQHAALQAHATSVADLMLQLQRLRHELKATEAAAAEGRSVSAEAAKFAAEERRSLHGELQRLRRDAWEASVKLLGAEEQSARQGITLLATSSSSSSSASASLCYTERGIEWLDALRCMQLRELAAESDGKLQRLQRGWDADRAELDGLRALMQQHMGDAKSKNSLIERQMQELREQAAAMSAKLGKAEQALGAATASLLSTQRALLCEQEQRRRAEEIVAAAASARAGIDALCLRQVHSTALREQRAVSDGFAAALDAERAAHAATKAQLQHAEALLADTKNRGSEHESALQRALRDRERELAQLKTQHDDVAAKLGGATAKAGSLQESVTSLSDQLRLAREAEARTRALHAQSVSDADRSRQEAAALQVAADELRAQLSETTERLGILQRKAEGGDSVVADLKRKLADALAERERESQSRAEQAEKLGELRDWAAQLRALHAQSITTVRKILAAEEACESGYSCAACLELMKDPIVLAPCGHSLCRGCYHAANQSAKAKAKQQQLLAGDTRSYCPECKSSCVTCAVPSASLDLLSGKFVFRTKALRELATVLERSTASWLAAGE